MTYSAFCFSYLLTPAAKYKIRILVSLHSAPNGNNRLENRDGSYEFGLIKGSVETMLRAVEWVSKR